MKTEDYHRTVKIIGDLVKEGLLDPVAATKVQGAMYTSWMTAQAHEWATTWGMSHMTKFFTGGFTK